MKTNFIFKISRKYRLLKAKKFFLSNTIYFNCLNVKVKCPTERTSGASMSLILSVNFRMFSVLIINYFKAVIKYNGV